MGRRTDDVLTVTVPGLSRKDAIKMKTDLMDMKRKVAPTGHMSIGIGRKDNIGQIMKRCNKKIGG